MNITLVLVKLSINYITKNRYFEVTLPLAGRDRDLCQLSTVNVKVTFVKTYATAAVSDTDKEKKVETM